MDAYRCARCGAFNRLGRPPAGKTPVCGRCKATLPTSGAPQPVGDDDFAAAIASAPVPVLIDFSATWCAPCRAVEPIVDALAHARAGRLVVLTVDIDRAPQTARRFGVTSVPTFALFAGGREVARTSGAMPRPALERWLDSAQTGPQPTA